MTRFCRWCYRNVQQIARLHQLHRARGRAVLQELPRPQVRTQGIRIRRWRMPDWSPAGLRCQWNVSSVLCVILLHCIHCIYSYNILYSTRPEKYFPYLRRISIYLFLQLLAAWIHTCIGLQIIIVKHRVIRYYPSINLFDSINPVKREL